MAKNQMALVMKMAKPVIRHRKSLKIGKGFTHQQLKTFLLKGRMKLSIC